MTFLNLYKKKAKLGNKVKSLEEAVKEYVKDNNVLGLCGSTIQPFALVYEIIRQKKKKLTVSTTGSVEPLDLLIGAGCVKQAEFGYCSLEIFGMAPNLRRAVEKGIPQRVMIEDYSNLSLLLRYLAGMLNLPFIPVRSLLRGSDLLNKRTWMGDNKLAVIKCPFSGDEVIALPPACPDVSIIHAQIADVNGNVQSWGAHGSDYVMAKASKRVIVTVEQVVDENTIRRDPNRTKLPGFLVDAIVEAPWGGHPWGVQGYYDIDMNFRRMYAKMAKERKTFESFLKSWVYGVSNHEEYIKTLGAERLSKLRASFYPSVGVNFGY